MAPQAGPVACAGQQPAGEKGRLAQTPTSGEHSYYIDEVQYIHSKQAPYIWEVTETGRPLACLYPTFLP